MKGKERRGTETAKDEQAVGTNYNLADCGERIRRLRKAHGYTQEQLAEAIGVDRSFLSRVEAGQKGCSVDLFIALAEVFQTSLDHLILGKTAEHGSLKAEIHSLMEQLSKLERML